MKIRDHYNEINALKNSITRQTIRYNDCMNQLKGMSLIKYLKGDLKDIIDDMDEVIEAIKLIGIYDEGIDSEILEDKK